tara:strand:- start:2415 stop:2828 length:414 start_codon:yes stop_codon:yes gene_type:complete
MIEEDFYATIKLRSGEEIFAKVAASEEQDRTMLIVSNPIMVKEIKSKADNVVGYKIEPWLKTTSEDMFIIKLDDVLTMSESSDIEIIMMYQDYVRNGSREDTNGSSKINRKMGYLGNVNDTKELLEKIYKSSNKESK